jgi:hypothetical protein
MEAGLAVGAPIGQVAADRGLFGWWWLMAAFASGSQVASADVVAAFRDEGPPRGRIIRGRVSGKGGLALSGR